MSKYSNRLMIVEKVLVSLSEKFESKISSLEDSRDIKAMMLADLMRTLKAQGQRRKMRDERVLRLLYRPKL